MAPTTRTYFFYGLNAIRVLSIVALILVFSSSIVDMVTNIKAVNNFLAQQTAANATTTTTSDDLEFVQNCDYIEGSAVPNQPAGVFWAVLSGLLIIFQTVVLILSEVGWPVSFFNRFFPVLGSDFGVGALGIFQCLIGAQILSHHVDEFTLVAAFFLFSIGCLNMFLGLVFREGLKQKRSILSYRNESRNVLPTTNTTIDTRPAFVNASPAFSKGLGGPPSEFGTFRSDSISSDKSGYGFGRKGEKAAGLRGFILQKPEESLPRYASPSPKPPSVRSRSPSPAPSARAPPPTMSFPPPPPVPQSSTSPLRLQRWRSVRTSGSSFVSPGAYRHEHNLPSQEDEDDNDDDIYEEDERSETPPPTFRSSPTAL